MATTLRFQIRGDTAEQWAEKNTKLLVREIGYDSTNRRLKVGDGKTPWKELPYLTTGGSENALSAEQGKKLKSLVDTNSSKLTELDTRISEVAAGGVSVIDNLTSTSKVAALSANQGKVLKGLIDSNKVSVLNNLTSTSTVAALSAAQGKALNDKLTTLQTTLTAQINKKADTTTVTNLQTTLTNLINKKADKTELTTLQTNLTTQINSSKVSVINNLTSTSTVAALSAAQGKVLNDKILERPDKDTVYTLINNQMEVSPVSASGGGNGYFKIELEKKPNGFSIVWGQISIKNQKVTFDKFSANSANAGYIGEFKGSATTPSSVASGSYATPIASFRECSYTDDTKGQIAHVVPFLEYIKVSNQNTINYKIDFFPRYRDGVYVKGASITVNLTIDYVVLGR